MKVADSYANLVQGVSQQVPHRRNPGQHGEQVNLLSDPVEGLARRHGSLWQAERNMGLDPAAFAAMTKDTETWVSFDYTNAGTEYTVLYRRGARPVGSTLPLMVTYNKTTKQFVPMSRNGTDAALDAAEAGGISAMTSVGKYLFFAANTVAPAAVSTDLWADSDNAERSVVWIRGGAYSRTYDVTATLANSSVVSFSYTTPTSSYPGLLDTSAVPLYLIDPSNTTQADTEALWVRAAGAGGEAKLTWGAFSPTSLTVKRSTTLLTNVGAGTPANANEYGWVTNDPVVRFHASVVGDVNLSAEYTHFKTIANPNYAAQVTEQTNEYNSQVTAWIGQAADALQPEDIAERLKNAAVAAGIAGAYRVNSTVILDGVVKLDCGDGGDDSLIRGVANEITDTTKVSTVHHVGKVVKVRSRTAQEAFYLRAVAEDPAVTSGYTPVYWVEGAGVEHNILGGIMCAQVEGGNMLVASTPTLMDNLSATDTPPYAKSTVGDVDSCPLPFFVGKRVTYLGVFQDRLLVGAGGVLRASKIGDYLNFFRGSVLSAVADDSLEMLAQGTDDDELRYSELYDRDLVIFGKKRQYVVSGRVPLSPTNANMVPMSSHADAADMAPLALGGLIFYSKRGEDGTSVHEIRPGSNVESPESFDVSAQLNRYIKGSAIEFSNHAKPAVLFVRSTGYRNGLYVFQYLDAPDGRQQAAWSRWEFNEALGPVIGMSRTATGLLVFTLRTGLEFDTDPATWVVADLVPLVSGLSARPYLDSLRPIAAVQAGTGQVHYGTAGDWYVAFDNTVDEYLLGAKLDDIADLDDDDGLWCGAWMDAYVEPTNPYRKDRMGNAITSGDLTITSIQASFAESSGYDADIIAAGAVYTESFNGRITGDPNNVMGREVVTTFTNSIPIGAETRDYSLKLKARKWLPFTLTNLEWVGQFFNRVQRF